MISIIIPTINEEAYMEPLLKSLKPQLHRGDEIIIVDSYSKDRTVEIAEGYECRIITVPKEGIAAAKNAGARIARNSTLAFLDADAIVSKNWLEKIRKHMRGDKRGAVAGLDLYWSISKKRMRLYNRYSRAVFKTAFMCYKYMGGKPWIPSNNCAINRELFFRLGGFANVVCEDVELMRRWPKTVHVHYDPSMKVVLSDRRFVSHGFGKTVKNWLVADIKALYGNGIHAKKYARPIEIEATN